MKKPKAPLIIEDILAAIKEETKRGRVKWHLTGIARIRNEDGDCPLAWYTKDPVGYDTVARQRGLSSDDIDAFMDAADYHVDAPGLRAELLRVTRLRGIA